MNTNKKSYDIVTGPNKDTLFDACKYAYVRGAKVPIDFAVALSYAMPKQNPLASYSPMDISDFKIVGIENEDGSGHSFNLHGYCKADIETVIGTPTYKPYRFTAYYNTKHRSGKITFIE